MPPITPDPGTERRTALLQSAMGVFMRYGYRKTSMDDLARAAGLSRQGLYLHFPSKDELFKEGLGLLAEQGLAAFREALSEERAPIECRLLEAFVALKACMGGGDMGQEHLGELFAAARQVAGPRIEDLEETVQAELVKAIKASGVAARWAGAGLSAKDLARHLQAASQGAKQQARFSAEYRQRMQVAVLLVCRADAPARAPRG